MVKSSFSRSFFSRRMKSFSKLLVALVLFAHQSFAAGSEPGSQPSSGPNSAASSSRADQRGGDTREIQALIKQIENWRSQPEDPYPMPRSTLEQLATIEKELTPSTNERAFQILKSTDGIFCTETRIKINYKIEDTSATESFDALFYQPRKDWWITLAERSGAIKPSRLPAIVMQPTLLGPGIVENSGISNALCRNGFASIVPTETILANPTNFPDLEAYDRSTRTEMIRARRMVDVLGHLRRVDHNKIGAIGFSRGAIAGALLIGVEPRVRYAFLGAGGVGIARVIARSKTELGIKNNEAQRAGFLNQGLSLSPEEYEKKLVETLRYDGLMFAHRFDPLKLKVMIVQNDTLVSTENQYFLRDAFCNHGHCPRTVYGEPSTLQRGLIGLEQILGAHDLGPHVGSILNLVFERSEQFTDFFKQAVDSLD